MRYKKNIKLSKINKPKLSNKKTTLAWVIFGILAVSFIFFTIQTSTSGATLSRLEEDKGSILEENQVMRSKFIYLSSLKNLEEQAEKLGFVKPQKIIYISEDEIVAKIP